MPATKSDTTVLSAVTLNAGIDAVRDSPFVDLTLKYGGVWLVKITNGATRLVQGVVVQAFIAANKLAGNDFPFDCRHVAGQEANEVSKFAIRIPPEVKFTKIQLIESDEDAEVTATFTSLDQV